MAQAIKGRGEILLPQLKVRAFQQEKKTPTRGSSQASCSLPAVKEAAAHMLGCLVQL